MIDKTLALAIDLIKRPSVTPADHGCQELMISRLAPLGFAIERLKFAEVDNFWARHGAGAPLVVFAGHTDVVPPGPLSAWTSDPFSPVVRDGVLYGRGAADMKSSLAAFVTAIETFLARHPQYTGSIGLLITSDEEGPSIHGTAKVLEWLQVRGVRIDHCIVGEPTSSQRLGDVIKHGRRGSLNGALRVLGTQGHVAYPHLARNPIHIVAPALAELSTTEWDRGNVDFPPTSFQMSNIAAGTGAENVIPGTLDLQFNFRFSTAVTANDLRQRVEAILARHGVDFKLTWRLSGEPYLTHGTALSSAAVRAIHEVIGIEAKRLTDGGTSDGRFIAKYGAEVIELGPLNATIHKVDECVAVADLARLTQIYGRILELLLL